MLRLQTPVTDERCKVGISYDDKTLMIGSCFSDNIGKHLGDYGFDVMVNPFGTLYNPISILNSLMALSGGRQFCEADCIQIGAGDDRWCSFFHHTSFARSSKEDFLEHAGMKLREAQEFFSRCSKVIITLGTSWCFRHEERNIIVSNCLKRPAAEFVRERLSAGDVAAALENIMEICEGKQVIFTVSPIRHFKDGAHGNQLSKSALLLGIDDLISSLEDTGTHRADYFPAYEIVMDELRDYRFYAEDMLHPSSQTSGYICDRFLDWALPEDEHRTLEDNIRRFRRESHRQMQ